MRKKQVITLLALATLAVSIQNFLHFRPSAPGWDEAEDEDAEEPDENEAEPVEPLAAIDPAALSHFLRSVPAPYGERSPFLSGDEADRLRAGMSRPSEIENAGPKLDGILWSTAHRVAWIDGRPVSEGELSGGQRVEHIAPHSVTLRAAGAAQFQLRLDSNEPGNSNRSPGETPMKDEVEEDGE